MSIADSNEGAVALGVLLHSDQVHKNLLALNQQAGMAQIKNTRVAESCSHPCAIAVLMGKRGE